MLVALGSRHNHVQFHSCMWPSCFPISCWHLVRNPHYEFHPSSLPSTRMGNLPDSLKITLGRKVENLKEAQRISHETSSEASFAAMQCPCITLGESEYLTAYLDTWAHEKDSLLTVSSGVIRFQKQTNKQNLGKQKKPSTVLKRNVLASICTLSPPSPSSDTLEMTSAVEAFYSRLFSLLQSVAHLNPTLYSFLLSSNTRSEEDWPNFSYAFVLLFCCSVLFF